MLLVAFLPPGWSGRFLSAMCAGVIQSGPGNLYGLKLLMGRFMLLSDRRGSNSIPSPTLLSGGWPVCWLWEVSV